ncbi:MAG: PhoU domain-containing protein, partial [Nanoarchaeota archaeon]
HLSINPSHDIAYSLLLIGIIRDVERMGDFCKNLMELYDIYGRPLETGTYVRRLIKIEENINIMFHLTKKAFENDDEVAAKKVMDMHLDDIAPGMDKMIKEIANDTKLKCKKAVVLALCARYFKRISAHLMGIASSVATPFDRIRHRDDHPI